MSEQPDAFELMESISAKVVEAAEAREAFPDTAAGADVFQLMELAMDEHRKAETITLRTLLLFVSVAHGLHEVSKLAREAGEEARANTMHALGQLFIGYAAGDIDGLSRLAGTLEETGDAVTLAHMIQTAQMAYDSAATPPEETMH